MTTPHTFVSSLGRMLLVAASCLGAGIGSAQPTPGSTGRVQVDVHVLDALGQVSKAIPGVSLDASSPFVQLNSSDLFENLATDESSRATVVIDSPRGTGSVGAYATVIDNLSEDAVFVARQPVP